MQDEQATTIGESIFVTGALSGHEDLTVLGRVEGTINLSKTLFVAESGIVKANVAVDDAVISGIVVGNVTATNSVQITETGRLLGDLQAPRVIVVAGARVRGQVDMSSRHRRGEVQRPAEVQSQVQAAQSAQAKRNAHGRFERLSLPARRPMPQAPSVGARSPGAGQLHQQSVAEAHAAGAHKARTAAGREQQVTGTLRPSGSPQASATSATSASASAQTSGSSSAGARSPSSAPAQGQAQAQSHAHRRAHNAHNKKRAGARRRD